MLEGAAELDVLLAVLVKESILSTITTMIARSPRNLNTLDEQLDFFLAITITTLSVYSCVE